MPDETKKRNPAELPELGIDAEANLIKVGRARVSVVDARVFAARIVRLCDAAALISKGTEAVAATDPSR